MTTGIWLFFLWIPAIIGGLIAMAYWLQGKSELGLYTFRIGVPAGLIVSWAVAEPGFGFVAALLCHGGLLAALAVYRVIHRLVERGQHQRSMERMVSVSSYERVEHDQGH